jgi:hypothetical protein
MWLLIIAALLQQAIPGVLSGPDPAQMEKAPDLGYKPVPHGLQIPSTITMGAPSGVGVTSDGHLIVFNRGPNALLEFDAKGALVRAIGQETFVRPHGFRIDPQGNLWVTDVNGHTVTKMTRQGEVLLTLGTKGKAGEGSGTKRPDRGC